MKIRIFLLALGMVFSSSLHSQIDSSSRVFSLIEAERSFAKMSVSHGMRHAFINNLADDGLIFRPGPVLGKAVWEQGKALPYVLKWEPEFADISQSGDMGYTTGPWELQSYKPLSNVLDQGYFTSIWQKTSDGTWKVSLDLGISCPPMTNAEIKCSTYESGQAGLLTSTTDLRSVDSLFAIDYSSRHASSFLDRLDKSARIHREGRLPAISMDEKSDIVLSEKLPAWQVLGGRCAASGDLGYTYGVFKTSEKNTFYYLRIWKKNGKMWKIVLDLNTIPPLEKTARKGQ